MTIRHERDDENPHQTYEHLKERLNEIAEMARKYCYTDQARALVRHLDERIGGGPTDLDKRDA